MNARPAAALLSVASCSRFPPPSRPRSPEAPVRVDAAAVGAPISPYVYGQFIEHLGRCIYGGLWAEMLEDRKFFYPVTGDAPAWEMFKPGAVSWEGSGVPYELLVRSPWMILGGKGAVTMAREGAYAGEHSPRVALRAAGAAAGLDAGAPGPPGRPGVRGPHRPRRGRDGRPHRGEPGLGRGRDRPGDGADRGRRHRLRDPRPALPLPRHDRQRPDRDRLARHRARSRSAPSR